MREVTYEVEVRPTKHFEHDVPGDHCVEVTRRVSGEKGCRILRRGFSSRRKAERFARSERRIARWFRQDAEENEVLRLTLRGGGS